MNTLKYKGYVGSVAYSEPDLVFFGKIEGIDDLVNYEGESVTELTAAFHEAVDDYLAYCEDHGLKPEKSYTGTFNVRISPMTHREIANLASEEGISINAFVKKALLEAVSRGYEGSKSSLVLEPSATYGSRKKVRITIPVADVPLAEELFKRLDWKVEE
ncbi:MAG: type II toxin-antitoxin system HicB family antitoxin [Bacteroidales bacterium]|jgi:Uncharacterized protein encoded in hypervariable junctions of pilus gene clusters|nr:type II toxin-antitoxin system HicB family antitoxin [Bacteroidales bacterium]